MRSSLLYGRIARGLFVLFSLPAVLAQSVGGVFAVGVVVVLITALVVLGPRAAERFTPPTRVLSAVRGVQNVDAVHAQLNAQTRVVTEESR